MAPLAIQAIAMNKKNLCPEFYVTAFLDPNVAILLHLKNMSYIVNSFYFWFNKNMAQIGQFAFCLKKKPKMVQLFLVSEHLKNITFYLIYVIVQTPDPLSFCYLCTLYIIFLYSILYIVYISVARKHIYKRDIHIHSIAKHGWRKTHKKQNLKSSSTSWGPSMVQKF